VKEFSNLSAAFGKVTCIYEQNYNGTFLTHIVVIIIFVQCLIVK